MPCDISPDDLHILLEEADAAARRLLRRLRLPANDLDDLRQDLLADLIARLHAYDPARGPLGAFAGVVLRHRAARLAERIMGERRRMGGVPLSLDAPLGDGSDATLADVIPEDAGLAAWCGQPVDGHALSERRMAVERALGALDRRDGALCAALSVLSPSELAAAGKGSRATLYRRIAGLRHALLAHGVAAA